MNKQIQILAAAVLSFAAVSGAWAAGEAAKQPAAAAATALTAAEVRKVDTAGGKVTLKHERIANLDMDPMTMVFRATRPEQLKGLKAGDKVRFRAESNKGALVVTHIEAAK
jgi:Cu(I)/Ag(I) efflux system periplasmic protein CusF